VTVVVIGCNSSKLLKRVLKEIRNMSAILEDLRAKVELDTAVTASAIELLNGLKERLDAAIASGDMSQVQELANALHANTQSLADAVAANTPAE
jgi:hypothetical protein